MVIESTSQHHGIGRRKSSVARVWLKAGKGKVTINGYPAKDYFDTPVDTDTVYEPLKVVGLDKKKDVEVNVSGGGKVSQAGAIRLGVARALVSSDMTLRPALKKHHFLHCDSRVKERKKYGQKGARRKFQFVKR